MINKKLLILIVIFISVSFMSLNVFGENFKNLKVSASSMEKQDINPQNIVDGNHSTRWSSEFTDPQWIMIDFGQRIKIAKVVLYWETAFGKAYMIQVSEDGTSWEEVYSTTEGNGGEDKITFNPVSGRYIRMYGTERGTEFGYSLFECMVYNDKGILISHPESKEEIGFLKNSSFENGTVNWKKSGNAGHIGVHDWHHYDGRSSYGIGNDNGPENAFGEISQDVRIPDKIKKGDLFIFKTWMMSEDKYSGKASIKIEFLNSDNKFIKSYQSKILSGRFSWTKVVVSGQAPKGTEKVIVKCVSRNMETSKRSSFIWFDNTSIDCPVITASSFLKQKFAPKNVMKKGKWRSKYFDNQWIKIDFRIIRKFNGLSIDWDKDYAKEYEILLSSDGKKWDSVYKAEKNKKGTDKIYFNETYAQFIKIKCNKSRTKKGFGIKEIELISGLVTLKKYYEIMALKSPAFYPRWLIKKQAYWTGVGIEGDVEEAIICEDGTIEANKRGYSIIPFLYMDKKLITRDNAKVSQSLEKKCLPLPSVKWNYQGVEMNVKLFTDGKRGESIAYIWYKIKNNQKKSVSGKFFLTIRPFQIFPPWQNEGGFSPINKIKYHDNSITVNDKFKLFPLIKPSVFGSIAGSKNFKFPFKVPSLQMPKCDITDFIKKGLLPKEKNIEDTEGFVSSALGYDFKLKPGKSKEFFIAVPLHDKMPDLNVGMEKSRIKMEFEKMFEKRIAYWESRVNKFEIDIPEQDLVDMLKANICYNLVTKDGAAFQPGSRSYEKSWMRDGGMAAAALLKMGLTSEVREFIDWYSGFQYENGLVPPIIDTRAEDPLWEEKPPHNLIEYDSQGEYVFTVLEYYNFTKDKEFLKNKLDNVKKALEYLVYLRKQTLTPEFKNASDKKRQYYGILPPSTSHEGYGCEYSYWDDFWALKGWKDGRTIFKILGRNDLADWADKEYADFKKCFYESVKLTAKNGNVDFIPASASLCDFDPTSTAVAIMYCDELDNLPQPQLKNTFDKYYKDLSSRFKRGAKYRFTPYELRSVTAFLYMGQKKRALKLLRFMNSCRRPYEWNQLAEVVNNEYRFPDYFGDMPHTWVGAEYINSFRSVFVYETKGKLVLGHGIDEKWLKRKKGVSVKNMPTYYGNISYNIKKVGKTIKIEVTGDVTPEKTFVFKSPFLKKKIKSVKINGKKWKRFTKNEVLFKKSPVNIVISY